jgi:hypothetical protein
MNTFSKHPLGDISLIAALILAFGLPAAGLASLELWLPAGGLALAALLWLLGLRYQNNPLVHLAFLGVLGLDVVVITYFQPAIIGQAGGLAALAAWDLSRFIHRRNAIHPPQAAQAIEKAHLIKLAGIVAAGLLLAGLSGLLQFNYRFVPAFFLGLLALISLRLVIRGLLRVAPEQPPD